MHLQAEGQNLPKNLSLLESVVKACEKGMHQEENHLSMNRVQM